MRKMLGIPQYGAARLIGVTPTQYMEWETGKRMPTKKYLDRICALYQTLQDSLYPEQRQDAVAYIKESIKKYGPKGTEQPKERPP